MGKQCVLLNEKKKSCFLNEKTVLLEMKHFFKLLPFRCDFLAMFILFEARFFFSGKEVLCTIKDGSAESHVPLYWD